MNIILNNDSHTFDDWNEMSITQLLKEKNYTFKMLIVKVNEQVVKRENFDTTFVHNGDNVAVIHLISGG